jgi:hypothetical protein
MLSKGYNMYDILFQNINTGVLTFKPLHYSVRLNFSNETKGYVVNQNYNHYHVTYQTSETNIQPVLLSLNIKQDLFELNKIK